MTVVDADRGALDPDLERGDLRSVVARRLSGRFAIDEWGLDTDLLELVAPLGRIRWSVHLEGEAALPEIGPALLVHTQRFGLSEPAVLAAGVARATGRPVRVTGALASVGPFAPVARRLGAVPGHQADLRSLLGGGALVGVPLDRQICHPFLVGRVPVMPLAVALGAGAPIIPVAVMGVEVGRRWTLRIGRPITTRRRRGVVDPAELAESTRRDLQRLVTARRVGDEGARTRS